MTPFKIFTLALSLFILVEAKAQCTSDNQRLLQAIRKNSDFVDYLCPDASAECTAEQIEKKVEISTISLRRPAHGRSNDVVLDCIVMPEVKGKQFPTLIYELSTNDAELLVGDWETGLSPEPGVYRHGFVVLKGKAEPEPGIIELYKLERKGSRYVEYQRVCFESDPQTGHARRKVRCK